MNTYESTYGKPTPITVEVPAEMLESIGGYPDKSRLVAELYAACADAENGLQATDIRWIIALGAEVLEQS